MLIRRYGGPEVFERGEVTTPRPGRGEVLVRVQSSSVNPVDCGIRAGKLKSFNRLRLPAVLGVDVAGEVAELGEEVTRFSPGDRVFAFTGIKVGGGYGEGVVLPESYLGRVPAVLSWAEAGTLPGVGATAYEAFTVHAPLEPGMRVFINGAAGGVGTVAIQIAKALGAEVTTTCSGAKASVALGLGADYVVDYTKSDPFGSGHGTFDVVLDAVRGTSLARLRKLLRPDGVLVTVNGLPWDVPAAWLRNLVSSRRTVVFFVRSSGAMLDGLATMIENGQVRPVVERTYTWDELGEAHRRVETGRVVGKVAVVADGVRTASELRRGEDPNRRATSK
ncbi:MAG: NADP-dependent oxidoreductase [Myxococcales bacterium]|nr:NADP-dependent oxidoreductase [Myxococcales bacterium]